MRREGEERRFTYAEIAQCAARLANLFSGLGVTQGDRIVVLLLRIPEWQIDMLACVCRGAVPIPCITMLTSADLAFRVAHSGAIGVAAGVGRGEVRGRRALAGARRRGRHNARLGGLNSLRQERDDFPPATVDAEAPAILYYNSGATGVLLPGVEVAVLTPDAAIAERAAAGELLLRLPNPQLMLGYWNDADRSEGCVIERGGTRWFRTGDNVAIDADGYVFYTGRADDIIRSAGYRIGPQEVANALSQHPAVQECAVVGVADEERGEIVKAWVVLNGGFEPGESIVQELMDHTKTVTAPYKYPRRVEFTDELPKTVTKIQRNLLRKRA